MLAAMLLATPVFGLTQQEIDRCAKVGNGPSLDETISACTAAIDSGQWRGRRLAWALNNRGFAYFLKGDRDAAFADFEQAIRLDPDDAVAFNNRGLIYQAKGELDRAIADYDATIRLDPTYLFAFNNRGGAYSDKHDYERAIADYTEAIRLNATFAAAIKGRANAYLAKRDFDHAIADDDAALITSWPGAIHEGNGTMQAIIDERADENQRDALLTILTGGETDDMSTIWWVFSAMCPNKLEPLFLPIEIAVATR